MRNFTKKYITLIVCSVVLTITVSSCSKDKYYKDGGLANPQFNGTVLQYLQSNPVKFDSVVQVIKLAGMEEVFSKESITFFAPTDEVIRRTIGIVNGKIPFCNIVLTRTYMILTGIQLRHCLILNQQFGKSSLCDILLKENIC
ncbi:hypothetical protein [Mucilaginibacter antarcticus]|uniref:hypothetical protein n=1 Tax=Mucilaginibacter antarcticus TaxID=1855725 RepID=UPI003642D9D1